MVEAEQDPTTATADSIAVHDLTRPAFDPLNGFPSVGQSLPTFSLLSLAREQGARTAVVEHLPVIPAIQREFSFLTGRMPSRINVDRITFWRADLNLDCLAHADNRTLLGYMILESGESSRGLRSYAQVREAVLATPQRQGAFLPRVLKTKVTVGTLAYEVAGIPFSEGDGQLRSCGVTSAQTLLGLVLRKRITLSAIYEVLLANNRPDRLANGLTLQQIVELFDSFGIQTRVVDYGCDAGRGVGDAYPARAQLVDAINAGGGALLAFSGGPQYHPFNHVLPIYGFTVEPRAMDYYLGRYYYNSANVVHQPGFVSLTPWVVDYLCSDQNIGPYLSLSAQAAPIKTPVSVIQVLPPSVTSSAIEAIVLTTEVLSRLTQVPQRSVVACWPQLQADVQKHDIVLNASIIGGDAYLQLLRHSRDWQNQREKGDIIDALGKSLHSEAYWMVEATGPRLFPQFLKYGEILVDVTARSRDGMPQLVLVRLPGAFYIPTSGNEMVFYESGMTSPTAFSDTSDPRRSSMMSQYEYDVALSFAGEDRLKARELADLLSARRLRIFFDEYEKAELWGKDLYQHLQSVYRDKAQYCVVFLSRHYAEKLWTKHELESAQARAFRESQEYILPLRLDDTEIPGINPTTGYIDLRVEGVDGIARLICGKLRYQ